MKLDLGRLLCKTQGRRFFLTITVKLRRIRIQEHGKHNKRPKRQLGFPGSSAQRQFHLPDHAEKK